MCGGPATRVFASARTSLSGTRPTLAEVPCSAAKRTFIGSAQGCEAGHRCYRIEAVRPARIQPAGEQPDGGTDLINASGLFDALAQYPEIGCWGFGMHHKSDQDWVSGEHLDETLADLLQKVLPPIVDPTATKVDTEALKRRACIPVNLNDVSGQKPAPACRMKKDNA
jgi:hypothetical protein